TPLSIQAYELFQQLSKIVQNTALTNAHDKWCYPWQNPEYSSIKMYHQLQEQEKAPPSFAKIWKCTAMLRYKIFIWLLLHDRVNVRNLLHRKKIILPNYKCELCNCSTEETTLHVFWDCPFALSCWDSGRSICGDSAILKNHPSIGGAQEGDWIHLPAAAWGC
uniref:Reverse transcriptase zinc-binding domain-containing protein n=1 Tax=Aegilops tauschii subsp. strangulata TaxID=200361 RepID=A0A453T9P9_AEGTS